MKEPTAWINKERDVITFDNLFPEMTPLYEKREWVGLTEDEAFACQGRDYFETYKAIDAKLKEKNG
jgi:hypothetical protein